MLILHFVLQTKMPLFDSLWESVCALCLEALGPQQEKHISSDIQWRELERSPGWAQTIMERPAEYQLALPTLFLFFSSMPFLR